MTQGTSPYFGCEIGSILLFTAKEFESIARELQELVAPLAVYGVHRIASSVELNPGPLDAASSSGITVAICIDRAPSEATERINLLLAKREIPCLFASVNDTTLQVGPWTYYGHTPCLECDRTTKGFFRTGTTHPERAFELLDSQVANLIYEAFLAIYAGSSELIDGLVTRHSFDGNQKSVSRSLKDPLCGVCSIWSRQPTEQFYVQ